MIFPTNRRHSCSLAGRSVKQMTARSISLNKEKATSTKLAQVPLLDSKTLEIVTHNVNRVHGPLERLEVDTDSANAVVGLIGKRNGGMQSFLATQEAIAYRLTQTMEYTRNMPRQQARVQVEETLQHY